MEEAMEYHDIEEPRQEPDGEGQPDDNVIVVNESEEDAAPINPDHGEQEDDDDEVAPAKRAKVDAPETAEPSNTEDDKEEDDSDQLCPICMDLWTNSGEHRLCSLKCGHLFGHSCVLRWLQVGCVGGVKRCPQCNKKAAVRDIRILYARKLLAVDTVENDRLRNELLNMTTEKNRLDMEVTRCHINRQAYEQQLAQMAIRIAELEKQQSNMTLRMNETLTHTASFKFFLEKTVDICSSNGCRVLDYNPFYNCIVASQKSASASLFSGFGIRRIDAHTMQPRQFVLMHNQAIRDIAFHPSEKNLLLSVSFDKTVKIMDIENNIVISGYPTDALLWSGCWSSQNSHTLLVGAANGSVTEFDMRNMNGAVGVLASPGDRSPVVSLATVPPNSAAGIKNGGFIAAHLNTCYAYEMKGVAMWTPRQMFLEGPFVSVRYDAKNHHALVSARPNPKIPNARHIVFTVERGTEEAVVCNTIHTFNGGNTQQILSRPCHINMGNDTFVAAHQESTKSIPLWSIASGKQMHRLPVSDPVLDICSFESDNSIFLATLSSSKLRLYKNR